MRSGAQPKPLRGAVEAALQITGLVELVEQMEGDHPVGLVGKIGADLFDQVLAEGARPACGLVNPGRVSGNQSPLRLRQDASPAI